MSENSTLRMSDEPIVLPSDDALGRDELAQIIAEDIENLDARAGAVVALNGLWVPARHHLFI